MEGWGGELAYKKPHLRPRFAAKQRKSQQGGGGCDLTQHITTQCSAAKLGAAIGVQCELDGRAVCLVFTGVSAHYASRFTFSPPPLTCKHGGRTEHWHGNNVSLRKRCAGQDPITAGNSLALSRQQKEMERGNNLGNWAIVVYPPRPRFAETVQIWSASAFVAIRLPPFCLSPRRMATITTLCLCVVRLVPCVYCNEAEPDMDAYDWAKLTDV